MSDAERANALWFTVTVSLDLSVRDLAQREQS